VGAEPEQTPAAPARTLRERAAAAGAVWASRRWIRVVTLCAIAAVISALSWPLTTIVPTDTGLDASWQVALHLAADAGLDYGSDIGFTYGPLGFLVVPQLVTGGTGGAAVIVVALLRYLLVLTLLVAARRAFGHILIAVPVAWFVSTMLLEVTEFAGLLAVLVALMLIQRPIAGRWAAAVPWAMGAAAGTLLLVKLNTGIVAIVVLAVAAWFQPPGRWRSAGAFVASAAAAFLVLWIATGNALGDLPRWASWSRSITSGYTGAVMLEEVRVDRTWEYPAYLLIAATLVGMAVWTLRRQLPRARLIAVAAVLAFGLWASFKHGFVRHDPHVVFTFISLAALPAAILWRGDVARLGGVVLVALGLVSTYQASGLDAATMADPFAGRAGRLAEQVRTVLDSERRAVAIDEARGALRARYAVAPDLLARIGTNTVHIAPHEASVAWAYGLTWRPLPHFQSFSTWTTALDEANRTFLLGARAPRYVLRQDIPRLDLHSPVWESPAENLALLCRYVPRSVAGEWELLERGDDRCGSSVAIGRATVRSASRIPVPDPGPDTIVHMTIDAPPSLWERLRSFVYKPSRQPQFRLPDVRTRSPYRIPRALLDSTLVVRAPVVPPTPTRIARLLDNDTVLMEYPDDARVRFFATPIAPPG
jgi:hypothetical protein